MVLFLAINTSSVTLLPTGVIALRASAGSLDAAGILPTTLFATACSTIVAIIAALIYRRFSLGESTAVETTTEMTEETAVEEQGAYALWVSFLAIGILLALIPITVFYGKVIAPWILPGLMVGFLAFGMLRRVPIYESFVDGAKEGFQVALRIIPYLVAILVAVGMFRASGALDILVTALGQWTSPLGMPPEALPNGAAETSLRFRCLRGDGLDHQRPAIGPDSYTGYLVSTLQGSTETTFYVLAVYFGAVQIKRIRHALWTALSADLVAVIAAVAAVSFLFSL